MPFLRGIGGPELAIILIAVLIIFGPKQIPKLIKMFRKSAQEIRSGFEDFTEEDASAQAQAPAPAPAPVQEVAPAPAPAEQAAEAPKPTEDEA